MLLTIPIQAVPAQQFDIVLNQQPCTIKIYQKFNGLYLDLRVKGEPLITGVLCRDRSRIVRSAYLGFVGDLYFVDQQGESDPQHTGLGERWLLMYEGPLQ